MSGPSLARPPPSMSLSQVDWLMFLRNTQLGKVKLPSGAEGNSNRAQKIFKSLTIVYLVWLKFIGSLSIPLLMLPNNRNNLYWSGKDGIEPHSILTRLLFLPTYSIASRREVVHFHKGQVRLENSFRVPLELNTGQEASNSIMRSV